MSDTMRDAFEAIFPMPSECTWTGNGYAATSYNAWDAHAHCKRWEGFKAAQSQPAPPPVGYVHPVRLRNLKEGTELSIALVAESEADLREGGDIAVYAAPTAQAERPAPPVPQTVQEIMRLSHGHVAACVQYNNAPQVGIGYSEKWDAMDKVTAALTPLLAALTALVDDNHRLKFELAGVNAMRRPLTREHIEMIARHCQNSDGTVVYSLFASAIETAHGIKP